MVAGPTVADRHRRGSRQRRQLVGGDVGPPEPGPGSTVEVEEDGARRRTRPRRRELDQDGAPGAQQPRDPSEQEDRVTTDPEVAVEEQGTPPPARAGDAVEDGPFEDRCPPGTCRTEHGRRHVESEHRDTSLRQGDDMAARSTADVEHGADGSVEDTRVGIGRSLQPRRTDDVDVAVEAPEADHGFSAIDDRHDTGTTARSRRQAAKREWGASVATARASS